ncbi:MAG: endonuclease/exonuclease/phosphatase family protein [Bacteroidales bacterium]|nr:endonuclease/exonuclease/phosphatase family protein [Bacteroidales bacterium]
MLIVKKILYIISTLCALALLLTYVSAQIPQDIFPVLSIPGYLYPLFLIINIVFIIVWLFLKPRHVILPLIAVLIRVDYVQRLVNVSSQTEDSQLRILSYNACNFLYKTNYNDAQAIGELQDSILHYIASKNADIVCFQDCDLNMNWAKVFHRYMTDSLDYAYFYCYDMKKHYMHDCAVYSKYPITDQGSILPESERPYSYIFADVKTPTQKVRIYNVHLSSYLMTEREKNDYKQIIHGKVSEKASKNIVSKIKSANRIRAGQIKELLPAMTNNQMPVIVCGDFNDHPFSNTYKKFTNEYSDSFVTKGNGIGRSYNGIFPAYRIDYILYKKSRLECNSYSSEKIDFSDHYPVFATFNFKME